MISMPVCFHLIEIHRCLDALSKLSNERKCLSEICSAFKIEDAVYIFLIHNTNDFIRAELYFG
jgi:hypothetical protein